MVFFNVGPRTIREKVATILLFRLFCGRAVVLGEDIFVIVLTLGFFDSGTFLVHRIVIDYIEVIHPLLLLSTTTTGAGCALLYRYIFLWCGSSPPAVAPCVPMVHVPNQ